MARKFQIDTPAQIGGLLEALNGITVTGNGSVSGTFSVGSTATITGKLTLTAGIAGALTLDTQATGTTHAVRADRNLTAGTGLTGGGNLTTDRTLTVDFTASGGDNGVGTKVARNDHTHGATYLGLTATAADSSKLGGVAAASYVQNTLQVIAGTGLTGGGTLAANRTLSVDFGTGATQVSAGNHNHDSVYAKLTGSTFSGDLTISKDGPKIIINSTGTASPQITAQVSGVTKGAISYDISTLRFKVSNDAVNWYDIIHSGGGQTISGALSLGTQATGTTHAVRADRTITAGTGLTGGGDLTANRTLNVDFGTGTNQSARGDHNHDTLYAKLSGATFTGTITATRLTATNGPSMWHDGANNMLDFPGTGGVNIAYGGAKNFTVGYGGAGSTFAVTGSISATTTLSAGTTISENGTLLSAKYAAIGRTITAGTGLTGGGDLSANRTLSIDFGNGSTQVARGDHNHDGQYVKLTGANFNGDITIVKNSASLIFNRPFGQPGQTAGLIVKDNSSDKGQLLWNFATSKWTLSNNGGTNVFDIIHSGGGQTIAGSLSATSFIEGGTALSSKYAAASHNHDSTYIKSSGASSITVTNSFISTGGYPVISKSTGYKSWIMHRPGSDVLLFAPSATANGEDWAWASQISFYTNGGIGLNGPLVSGRNTGMVSFAPGVTSVTLTHNINSANYRLAFGANNHARHVAWANKGVNTVDITIDSSHTETITVDVIIIPY